VAATRQARGLEAWRRGAAAERLCEEALAAAGFDVLGRRVRTPSGELDLVARRGTLTVIVEVKARATAEAAAFAIPPPKRRRLAAAAEALMAAEPSWFGGSLRFDAMLVAADGSVMWLEDAFRPGE
jgi:putative endonuclease